MKKVNGYKIKQYADLAYADLRSANLRCANLRCANLMSADLTYADLTYANLTDANLRYANLTDANLSRYANLRYANLTDANLTDADLTGARLPHFQIVPQEGEFIAYKKAYDKNSKSVVIKLLIPKEAKRTSSLIGRKCRAEFVKVIGAINSNCRVFTTKGGVGATGATYKVGEMVYPDKYDDDIRVVCTHGIHFFITQKEAKNW